MTRFFANGMFSWIDGPRPARRRANRVGQVERLEPRNFLAADLAAQIVVQFDTDASEAARAAILGSISPAHVEHVHTAAMGASHARDFDIVTLRNDAVVDAVLARLRGDAAVAY